MKVYGITNCNTVKKATTWLKGNNIPFEFVDYKKSGVTKEKLQEWVEDVGWEKLLNKKGTTWRALPEEKQRSIINNKSAIELMIEKPSVIKRPVVESKAKLIIGFDEIQYAALREEITP